MSHSSSSPESAPLPASSAEARQVYEARRARFADAEARHGRRSRRFSYARLAVVIVGLFFFMVFLTRAQRENWVWVAAGLACFGLFGLLARFHDRVIRSEKRAAALRQIQVEALARLERRWRDLPETRPPAELERRPKARDLDLFGPNSLFRLLSTAHTPPGKSTLAGWLMSAAEPDEIGARQAAVGDLAGHLPWRQELERRARTLAEAEPDPEPFLRWAEAEPWLLGRPGLLWLARGLALASVGGLVAAFAGWIPFALWGLIALGNVAFCYAFAERTVAVQAEVSAREGGFLHYARTLEHLEESRFQNPLLAELRAALEATGRLPSQRMDQLHRRVVLSDVRHSGTLAFLLQALLVWDLQIVALLEAWQRDAGHHARRWLAAVGEIEALAALAGLVHDHPHWAFPEITVDPEEPPRFVAQRLGHPLLAPAVCVGNDVELGPPGTFLLVTGSNMSGKSTLLRSIGINAVLALAGGPVCARGLRLPPLELGTSLLIEDSLESGLSYFMAELTRIKAIVDEAARSQAAGRPLLFLLDEVLRGTNAVERQIAVERVIGHLLARGAIGAVSTHDLGLAEADGLKEACRNVHLKETLHPEGHDPPMTFDYKLRPGIATTANALKLLELIGLGEQSPRRAPSER